MNIYYRIGVIDNYRNSHSFIEYKKYGPLVEFWDACTASGPKPLHQKPDDRIYVFLNSKQIGSFLDRKSAELLITKLLSQSPTDLSDLQHHLF